MGSQPLPALRMRLTVALVLTTLGFLAQANPRPKPDPLTVKAHVAVNVNPGEADAQESGAIGEREGWPWSKGCWKKCGQKPGPCKACKGAKSHCCKKGVKGNGCNGEQGSKKGKCVKPDIFDPNKCWKKCGKKSGPCKLCKGAKSYCCKKGVKKNGCNGKQGSKKGKCVKPDPVTKPPTEPPTTETPVTETPVTETPVTDEQVTEEPVTEEPVTEEPVTEEPVTEPEPKILDTKEFDCKIAMSSCYPWGNDICCGTCVVDAREGKKGFVCDPRTKMEIMRDARVAMRGEGCGVMKMITCGVSLTTKLLACVGGDIPSCVQQIIAGGIGACKDCICALVEKVLGEKLPPPLC